jgi:hypothetical protein
VEILIAIIFVVGIGVQLTAFILVALRVFDLERKLKEAVDKLTAAEEQRHMDELAVKRSEILRTVNVDPVKAMDELSRIVSFNLARPVTLEQALRVAVSPVPAMVFTSGREEEVILTTNADAYVEDVLVPARRIPKGKSAPTTTILPGVDQLVVDEELYQCYMHLADELRVADAETVPHVNKWYVITLEPMQAKKATTK